MSRTATTMMMLAFASIGLASLVAGKKQSTVPFNHTKHVVDAEMACLDCHASATSASTSSESLLPSLDDCYVCHDQADMNWQPPADGSSPWPTAARELIFDHAKHAADGIECATCHASVAQATKAPSHGLPEMSVCTDCHHESEIADDCNICHTQAQFLRPKDHVADWVLDHRLVARGDAQTCETCHRESYCSECHEGAALVMAVEGEADAPTERIGPMAAAHESNQLLVLQRAHNLNYRYTHGSDVHGKIFDCAACHETQSFCNACHNPENEPDRFRPIWHEVADFELRAHADYARRDIENCASCHDQSGAEPNCIRCHKTIVSPHPAGFMQDVNGPWHDDDNAVCFVCHEPGARDPGVGFCGGCHGRNP